MNTVAKVAEAAGVHQSTVARWIKAGIFGEVQQYNKTYVITAKTAAEIIEYAQTNVKRRMTPAEPKAPPAATCKRKWRNIGEMIEATKAGHVQPRYIGMGVPEGVEG